jgi:hypothetical protein
VRADTAEGPESESSEELSELGEKSLSLSSSGSLLLSSSGCFKAADLATGAGADALPDFLFGAEGRPATTANTPSVGREEATGGLTDACL